MHALPPTFISIGVLKYPGHRRVGRLLPPTPHDQGQPPLFLPPFRTDPSATFVAAATPAPGPNNLKALIMKFFTTGLVSTLALLFLTALIHRLAHVGTPAHIRLSFRRALSRVFRVGAAPEVRDLKKEIETAHPRLIIPEHLVEYQRFSLKSRLQNRFHIRGAKEPPMPTTDNSDQLLYGHGPPPPPPEDHNQGGLGRGSRLFFGRVFPRKSMGIHRIRDLPRELTPVVAVVNSKSGGRQGKILIQKLRRVLSRAQVIDIRRVNIQEALTLYSGLRNNVTLMVCGGDGTASRIFETIESMKWTVPPRVAVVPLGTGNDLARVLNWGSYSIDWSGTYFIDSDEALLSLFDDLERAIDRRIDRWQVDVTPGTAVPSLDRYKQPVKYMINYFSIGIDGRVVLDFHKLREKFPYLFIGPAFNKFLYGLVGARDLFRRSCKNLPEKLELWCDGHQVDLPPETEGIIILNINSHAGGVVLWPEGSSFSHSSNTTLISPQAWYQSSSSRPPDLSIQGSGAGFTAGFTDSRFDDGILEVVATKGILHLGRMRVGLGEPIRVAQARHIRIKTKAVLPGQVDGEPWRLPRCELSVRCSGQAMVLQHLSKELVSYTEFLVREGHMEPAMKDKLLEAFMKKAGG